MSDTKYGGGCDEFAVAWGVDPKSLSHCSSCHEDEAEGYEMIVEADGPLGSGKHFSICCVVSNLKGAPWNEESTDAA